LVNDADVVILALGIDKTIEHEGLDRTTIDLPGLQKEFMILPPRRVHYLMPKTVVCNHTHQLY